MKTVLNKIGMSTLGSVALAAVISLTSGQTASAASATLILSGTVTSTADIVVTPTALATALTIADGVVNQKVATVNERSNNLLGYNVTISSANATARSSSTPFLARAGGGGEEPTYTLTYGLLPVIFVGGTAVVTPVGVLTGSTGLDKDVAVTIVPGQVFTQGTYSDTLTLTLSNN